MSNLMFRLKPIQLIAIVQQTCGLVILTKG